MAELPGRVTGKFITTEGGATRNLLKETVSSTYLTSLCKKDEGGANEEPSEVNREFDNGPLIKIGMANKK
jgi:hypothetical protein